MTARKPCIKAASVPWLDRINAYIRQYDVRGCDLPNAASDVLDGLAYRSELEDLIRRRLLAVVRYGDGNRDGACGHSLCGSSWSVHLTQRAIQALWPDRAQHRQRPSRAARPGASAVL